MTENQLTYGNKAKNLEFVARNTDIEITYFCLLYKSQSQRDRGL